MKPLSGCRPSFHAFSAGLCLAAILLLVLLLSTQLLKEFSGTKRSRSDETGPDFPNSG
jgi:hypothetical protein